MRTSLIALCSGLLFGLGLAISGMTSPDKVLNFLDVTGTWDPSLALVMAAALAVSAPGFAWMRRRQRSFDGNPLPTASTQPVSARLLLGAALFGVGWGIAGYCPGPALANLGRGSAEAAWFVVALLIGSQLARLTGKPA